MFLSVFFSLLFVHSSLWISTSENSFFTLFFSVVFSILYRFHFYCAHSICWSQLGYSVWLLVDLLSLFLVRFLFSQHLTFVTMSSFIFHRWNHSVSYCWTHFSSHRKRQSSLVQVDAFGFCSRLEFWCENARTTTTKRSECVADEMWTVTISASATVEPTFFIEAILFLYFLYSKRVKHRFTTGGNDKPTKKDRTTTMMITKVNNPLRIRAWMSMCFQRFPPNDCV